jgi:ribokinase
MAAQEGVAILGIFVADLAFRAGRLPKIGETITGSGFKMGPGGKGSNQAVAAARSGGEVAMVGRVGADAFGDQLRAMAESEGIDTRFVGIDPHAATGVALIEVDAQGQNSIAVASGANFTLTEAGVASAFAAIDRFDLLVMPLETPMETVVAAANLARKAGARVVLNPAPAQHLAPELLRNVDVLIPNEHEAAFMAGTEFQSGEDARKAAEYLLGCGPRSVVVTLGSQGALIAERQQDKTAYTTVPAFPVRPIDTTAAGDAFVGALAVALGEGRSLAAAAHFASAAAAISVTRTGAQPSLPTRAETESFLRARSSS